jgi:hypothetical protein
LQHLVTPDPAKATSAVPTTGTAHPSGSGHGAGQQQQQGDYNPEVFAPSTTVARSRAVFEEPFVSEAFVVAGCLAPDEPLGNEAVEAVPIVLFCSLRDGSTLAEIEDLARFCQPANVTCRPIFLQGAGEEARAVLSGVSGGVHRTDTEFVFMLSSHSQEMHGSCVLVEELVGELPSMCDPDPANERKAMPPPSDPAAGSRPVVGYTTLRSYCILSRYPFHRLHFSVLRSIIALDRQARAAARGPARNLLEAALAVHCAEASRRLSKHPGLSLTGPQPLLPPPPPPPSTPKKGLLRFVPSMGALRETLSFSSSSSKRRAAKEQYENNLRAQIQGQQQQQQQLQAMDLQLSGSGLNTPSVAASSSVSVSVSESPVMSRAGDGAGSPGAALACYERYAELRVPATAPSVLQFEGLLYPVPNAKERLELLDGFGCSTVLQVMSLKTIVTVLSALLTEQRVVICCTSQSVLSSVVLSFLSLLRPYPWICTLIPVLPLHLSDFLHAPTPYLMGIQSRTCIPRELGPESGMMLLVDIDTDKVIAPEVEGMTIPMMPRASALLKVLEEPHAALLRLLAPGGELGGGPTGCTSAATNAASSTSATSAAATAGSFPSSPAPSSAIPSISTKTSSAAATHPADDPKVRAERRLLRKELHRRLVLQGSFSRDEDPRLMRLVTQIRALIRHHLESLITPEDILKCTITNVSDRANPVAVFMADEFFQLCHPKTQHFYRSFIATQMFEHFFDLNTNPNHRVQVLMS